MRRHLRWLAPFTFIAIATCGEVGIPVAPENRRQVDGEPFDTSFAPVARAVARDIARALGTADARIRTRDLMRASKLGSHKLLLDRLHETPPGMLLIGDFGRSRSTDTNAYAAPVRSLPPLDVAFPYEADRRTWDGTTPPLVAFKLRKREPRILAYTASGDSVWLALADGKPALPLIIVSPAGDRSKRIGPQPDAPGTVIQDAGDGQVSGTLYRRSATGHEVRMELADIMPELQSYKEPGLAPRPDTGIAFHNGVTHNGAILHAFYHTAGDGWGDGESEPYFKGWYMQHFGEVRFYNVRRFEYYYPDVQLVDAAPPWQIWETLDVQGWEDDPFNTDTHCADIDKFSYVYQDYEGKWGQCGDGRYNFFVRWAYTAPPPVATLNLVVFSQPPSGCTMQYSVNATAADGSKFVATYLRDNVLIVSDDPSVANSDGILQAGGQNISATGNLHANSVGSTTVWAFIDGASVARTVSPTSYVTSMTVAPTSRTLNPGQSASATVTRYRNGEPVNYCTIPWGGSTTDLPLIPVRWNSSNPAVATTSPNEGNAVTIIAGQQAGTAVITPSAGALSATVNVTVTIPPTLSVSITGPNSVRPNASCTFFANGSGASNLSYTWTINGAYVGSGPEIMIARPSSYPLKVEVTSPSGGYNSATKNVTVTTSAQVCFQ